MLLTFLAMSRCHWQQALRVLQPVSSIYCFLLFQLLGLNPGIIKSQKDL